ncbi:hypothetical protein [Flavobacterium sp. MK4S-17]|uniref:hypothetical protein n=1 Tax=Flavobacterium sp. MK4S-17 TaxID=2543737 RepID=UPI0013588648|nr:hypothetical protein [Flavobacterium sp. MK4S-17]
MKNRIYAWARDYTQDYSLVMGMSFTEWFKIWWSRVDFINKVLFVLSAISPLIIITSLKKIKLQLIVFFIISYICFLLWLQAPDFRFSFGFILFLGLLSLLLIAQRFKTKYQLKSNSIVIFTIILLLSLHVQAYPYYRAFFYNNLYSRLYKPVDISAIKFKKSVRFKKKTYITPNNKEQVIYGFYAEAPCYDQFPCSPELDDFRMRGDDLKDGFLPAD